MQELQSEAGILRKRPVGRCHSERTNRFVKGASQETGAGL